MRKLTWLTRWWQRLTPRRAWKATSPLPLKRSEVRRLEALFNADPIGDTARNTRRAPEGA